MNSKQLRKIFHPFTKIPGVRPLLGGLYRKLIYEPARKREIANFQKNGLTILREFDSILRNLDIPYCLIWGSLIGAVREKGFIKHDFDIDVAMWREDYSDAMDKALLDAGFRHVQRFLIDGGENGMEDTYEKEGVAIDIFYFVTDSATGSSFCCTLDYIHGEVTWEDCFKKYGTTTLFRHDIPLPHKFVYTPFESIELPIPENYDFILRGVYGDNYMTPDPNWTRGVSPFRSDFIGRKIEYQTYDK
ncbi:MAG: LicD family protein, partial [Muribaculaceae bacterium]|nr:LicD family protein [Muribaculaceae bacterium]